MTGRAVLVVLIGGLVVSSAIAADDGADALKQRIVAHARTVGPEDFAFTRTARVEQIEGEKKETRTTVEKYDPRKPADQRWTLVTIDNRAPTAEELKAHRKEAPKAPRGELQPRGRLPRRNNNERHGSKRPQRLEDRAAAERKRAS
jgi:hypothetical protein